MLYFSLQYKQIQTFSSYQVADEVEEIYRTNKEGEDFWDTYSFMACNRSIPGSMILESALCNYIYFSISFYQLNWFTTFDLVVESLHMIILDIKLQESVRRESCHAVSLCLEFRIQEQKKFKFKRLT